MPAVPAIRRMLPDWDWPTLGLMGVFVAIWGGALLLPAGWGALAVAFLVLALTLHSSLSHEFLHGHPFGIAQLETVTGLWQPGLFVPYLRFKRTHLAHHRDAKLTDPYDDPESNYLDPVVWEGLAPWMRAVLRVNNTLSGRIIIGPLVGMLSFYWSDLKAVFGGDRAVLYDWLAHLPGVMLTIWVVSLSELSIWAYLLACYLALSMLRIRTFAEHQAHDRVSGRTVIIEDRGPLGFLFLYNSLHLVHHMYPSVPWYRLWPLYLEQRERFVMRNHGYVYSSYGAIFRHYFWRAKDPVAHPLWRRGGE